MDPLVYLLLGLLLGAVIGALAGWLIALRRQGAKPSDMRLEQELREQLEQRSVELGKLRVELKEMANVCATAEAKHAAGEQLLADQRRLHEQHLSDAKEAQQKALDDLRERFKALSADALREAHPEFLRLANETFARFQEIAKGDLLARQQSIVTVVKPLEEQLRVYQQRLQQSDGALGEVKQYLNALTLQSQALSNETVLLRRILSSNQARGRWGEETLRRVVEAAGMSVHCDFTEQVQAGDAKPDLIVRLPGDRCIIVDSKVPDLDFLQTLDSSDETSRAEALAAHASKLKATIKALAEREYPRQFPNALEHVVLFLPAESLFSAALEGDPGLIVWAANRHILIATPASLIALLWSASVSWQQHAQTENAREIAEAAQELFNRVCKFTEHFEKLRSGLERANEAYNEALGSYQRSVRPSGERLLKLGGSSSGKELIDLQPLSK